MTEKCKDNHLNRRSASLLMRALLVGMALLVSNAVAAGGSFLLNPSLNDLKEGNVLLAPIGDQGAGVRMSMGVPGQAPTDYSRAANNGMWQVNQYVSEAYMSVVIPW